MEPKDAGVMPAFVDYRRLGFGTALLCDQFASGDAVHAYLISGPRGVGKATFAKYLVMSAFCTDESKPCGRCEACRRILTGNEPDVLSVTSVEGKQITIDAIRGVIEKVSQHSFGNGARIVMIEPIERMTPQAQNCLLKSLEEPPSNVIFLLMAHETTAVLGTIASRCCRVKLTPWPDEILKQTLLKMGFSASLVEDALQEACGNIGQALQILGDESKEHELRQLVLSILDVRRDADVVSLSTKLKDDREGAERALNALETEVYHALLSRTGRRNANSGGEWGSLAQKAPVQDLTSLMQDIFETRRLRLGQVNWQTSIDHLLMKIMEAKNRWQLL